MSGSNAAQRRRNPLKRFGNQAECRHFESTRAVGQRVEYGRQAPGIDSTPQESRLLLDGRPGKAFNRRNLVGTGDVSDENAGPVKDSAPN